MRILFLTYNAFNVRYIIIQFANNFNSIGSLIVENHENKLYCRRHLNVNVFKKQRKLLRNNFTLHQMLFGLNL